MEKGNRVAIYGRVSTGEQSVDMQVSELTDYAQNRGWLIVDRYLDCGVSGSKESRPALNRLMNDARQRKFDILLVWKIDRFGRSLKHLVNSLAELEEVGVAFVSLRDSLDLSSPAGRLMAQLLGAISEIERSLITERVRAGIRNGRSKGRRLGRPRLGGGSRQNFASTGKWCVSERHFGATWDFPWQRPPCPAFQNPLAPATSAASPSH